MYPKDKYRSHSGLGTNVARVAAAARDMIFTCGTRRAGRALVEQGHEVYHYQWNHEFTGWRNVSSCDNLLFLCGNYHASELTYVWQKHLNSLNKNDRDMTAVIGTYWTNFAKNGDPNIGMSPADITGNELSNNSRLTRVGGCDCDKMCCSAQAILTPRRHIGLPSITLCNRTCLSKCPASVWGLTCGMMNATCTTSSKDFRRSFAVPIKLTHKFTMQTLFIFSTSCELCSWLPTTELTQSFSPPLESEPKQ